MAHFSYFRSSNLIKGLQNIASRGFAAAGNPCKGLWATFEKMRAIVESPVVTRVTRKTVGSPRLISHTNKAQEGIIGVRAVTAGQTKLRRPAPLPPTRAVTEAINLPRFQIKTLFDDMSGFIKAQLSLVTSENKRYFDDSFSARVIGQCEGALKKGWKVSQIKAVLRRYIATLNSTLSKCGAFKSLAEARKTLVSSAFTGLQNTFQESLQKMSDAQCVVRYKYHSGKALLMAIAREKNLKVVITENGFDLFKPVMPSDKTETQPSTHDAARTRKPESFKKPVSQAARACRMKTKNKIALAGFVQNEMQAFSGLNSSITNESTKQMQKLSVKLVDKLTVEQSRAVMSKVVAMLKPGEGGGFWTVEELMDCLESALKSARTEDTIIREFYATLDRRLDDKLWNEVIDEDFSDEDDDDLSEQGVSEVEAPGAAPVAKRCGVKPLPNPKPQWLMRRQGHVMLQV